MLATVDVTPTLGGMAHPLGPRRTTAAPPTAPPPAAGDRVVDITQAEFMTRVVEASHTRPVVVDFWAPWCGPCRQLSPLLEDAAARHAGDVDVVKLNVDNAPALAQQLGIQGIPAVKAFRDGRVVAEFVGLQPPAAIEQFFAQLAPSPADRLVARAATATDEEAEPLLRQALEAEAGHPGATVALSRRLADRGETEEAIALLEKAPQDPAAQQLLAELRLTGAGDADLDTLRAAVAGGDVTARPALGRALAAVRRHEEAVEVLLDAVRDPETREEGREALVEMFTALGDDHPLVRAARPQLAAALF